jgi:hypothetical protein
MSGIRHLLRLAAVSLLAALAGGCYFSAQRVIERGSDIGLAEGKWQCRNGSGTEELTVEKRDVGTAAAPDIIYRVDNKEDYRLEAIGRDLYLVQSAYEPDFAFAFLAVTDGGREVRILARKKEAAAAVRALAVQNRIKVETFSPLNDEDSYLAGTREEVRALLRALEPSVLAETGRCRKAS